MPFAALTRCTLAKRDSAEAETRGQTPDGVGFAAARPPCGMRVLASGRHRRSTSGTSQTAASGGSVTPAENARPWSGSSSAVTPPPLPTPEPPYASASVFSTSRHAPPTRQGKAPVVPHDGREVDEAGEQALAVRRARADTPACCPPARRRRATRSPSGRKSTSQSAGSSRYTALRSATHRCIPGGADSRARTSRATRLRPLGALAELAAHEEQLLARVRPHVPEERAQAGELLPLVARLLAEQRPLPVHDLVVGEREDEVLVPGVDHRERQLVVVPPAMDRLQRDVRERVVHPAHVPLEGEPEPAAVGRPRDAGPGGRLLGDHRDARVRRVHDRVELLEELRPPRGPRGRRSGSAPTRPARASSRGTASRRRRRREGRPRGTPRASRARSRRGSSAPRGGRS